MDQECAPAGQGASTFPQCVGRLESRVSASVRWRHVPLPTSRSRPPSDGSTVEGSWAKRVFPSVEFPTPRQPKSFAMPPDERIRFDVPLAHRATRTFGSESPSRSAWNRQFSAASARRDRIAIASNRPESSSTIAAVIRQCRKAARRTNQVGMNAQDRTLRRYMIPGKLWIGFLRNTTIEQREFFDRTATRSVSQRTETRSRVVVRVGHHHFFTGHKCTAITREGAVRSRFRILRGSGHRPAARPGL